MLICLLAGAADPSHDDASHRSRAAANRPASPSPRKSPNATPVPSRPALKLGERFARPVRARIPPATGPLWRFSFRDGDTLTAELLKWDAGNAALRWRNAEWTCPVATLAAISQPDWAAIKFYEDFESPLAANATPRITAAPDGQPGRAAEFRPGDNPWRPPLTEPLRAGTAALRFFEREPAPAGGDCVVRFVFGRLDAGPIELTIALGGPEWLVESRGLDLAVERLRRRPGWHRLALELNDGRLLLLVDEAVLAHGRAPAGDLSALVIEPAAGDASTGAALWVDDVLWQAPLTPPASRVVTRVRDCLWRTNGDQVFGECLGLDRKRIAFQSEARLAVEWPEVRGVWQRSQPHTHQALSGWWADVALQPWHGQPFDAQDRLRLAVQDFSSERLLAEHPALGRVEIDPADVRSIDWLYHGSGQLLEPAVQHLGRTTRADFRWSPPGKTQWSTPFDCPRNFAEGKVFLSLCENDLEPAAPETDPTSPTLATLRRGELTTELLLNGQSLGTLNSRIASRSPAARPSRLRVLLPQKLLKPTRNRLELRLHPTATLPADYDDWEFSRLTLEIED